jgi:hypothetical protein
MKKIEKLCFLSAIVASACVALSAQADSKSQSAPFVLISGTCDHSSEQQSTAYVFSDQGRVYVLGSSELVFNSDSAPFCQTLVDESGSKHSLKLIAYDWSYGLALFTASDLAASVATPIAPASAGLLEKVSWHNGNGVVVADKSVRHQFPEIAQSLEVHGDPVSMQAVGSAVLNSSGNLVGVVSSELVEKVPGESSRVVRWTDRPGVQGQNFIVIPGATIADWVSKVTRPDWTPLFKVSSQDQIAKVRKVAIGSFSFTEGCPPDGTPDMDPDFPIGGGDPGGIGGSSLDTPACNFAVAETDSNGVIPSVRSAWFNELLSYLKSNNDVTVKTAYLRDSTGLLQSQGAVSLENFGQILLGPDLGFMIALKNDPTSADPNFQKLRTQSQALIKQAEAPEFYCYLMSMRQRAYLYGGLMLTDDWKQVTLADLQGLDTDSQADQIAQPPMDEVVKLLIDTRKAIGQ